MKKLSLIVDFKDEGYRMLKFLQEKSNVINWMAAIFYRFALDSFYYITVSQMYGYEGLKLQPDELKYLISWVIYIFLFGVIDKKEKKMKNFFLHMQLAIMIGPMLTYYSLADGSTRYVLIVTVAILLQIILLKKESNVKIQIDGIRNHTTIFVIAFVILIVIATFVNCEFYGVDTFNLNFLYEVRENLQLPTILKYCVRWCYYSIIPFFIVYNLKRKKINIVILLVITDIILYMLLGAKYIYLSLGVIFVVFLFAKLDILIKSMYLGLGGICLSLTVMEFLGRIQGAHTITRLGISFVGERFLFLPAMIKFAFYNCFSENPKVLFADGMLGKIFGLTYLYDKSTGETVGNYIYGMTVTTNTNTGYLGEGYAQAGFLGVIVFSVVLAMIIKFLDGYTENLGYEVAVGAISPIIIALNDGSLLTILLSGGFFLTIMFFVIYADMKRGREIRDGKL